ncbi:MAG: sodium:phosphate symporter, partial [Halobacteriales archaeon]
FRSGSRHVGLGGRPLAVFEPATGAITGAIGPGPAFLLAVAVLFGSLKLFDRVLAGVDTATLRRRFFRQFRRTWLAFGVGLLITSATTSVAFSLGVIVPLYNRRYVKREELIPYVLGANLGTLLDTLVVAVVLPTPTGVAVVLFLLVIATAVTLAALAVAGPYTRLVATIDDRLVEDRVAFGAFVAGLLLLPLALLLLPLAWP